MKNPYFWIYFFTAFAFLGLRDLPEVSTSGYWAAQSAVDLDYGGIDFCQAAPSNPIPTFSPAGGTFTADAGLVVNALTGEINLAASTIGGPYEITYTVGVESANYFVFIIAPPNPAISYPQNQLCMSPTPPPAQRSPNAVSPAGGTFTITPAAAGLTINSSNGIIGFNSSTPSGTYTITYTVSQGGCTAQSTFAIELAQPVATPTLSYPQASYCPLSPNPSPTFSPAGGAFTASPAGLSINASTGVVNLAGSTAGT